MLGNSSSCALLVHLLLWRHSFRGSSPPTPTPTHPRPPLQGDLRGVSYEDSKYLGGDVAHTHLVKGLDFALLQKVRGVN